jgi:hypothetical protein
MLFIWFPVTGHLHEKASTMQVVADTFPAGTLTLSRRQNTGNSSKNTKKNRNFYGGHRFMILKGILIMPLWNFPEQKSPITLSSRSRNCCRIRRRKQEMGI